MDYISLFGIAVGLSMDAFAVSITNGAVLKKVNLLTALRIAACFGIFQGAMPSIGWSIGKVGEQLIHTVDHWIALILLCYLGIKMIWDSRKKDEADFCEKSTLKTKTLLAMAVATSIDALATGVILPSAVGAETLLQMLCSISAISVITFTLCLIGVFLGKKFGCLLHNKSSILGGIVLICIGIKIFVEQMFF